MKFRLAAVLLASLSFQFTPSCQAPVGDTSGGAGSSVQTLQDLLNTIDLQSDAWRAEVDAAVRSLSEAGHNIIANDLAAVVNDALQASGQEFRCSADFLRDRVDDDIEALIARLQGERPPEPSAVVCSVLKSELDLNEAPANLEPLTISGYDFRKRSNGQSRIQLWARAQSGATLSANRLLSVTSNYQATVALDRDDGCWLIEKGVRSLELRSGQTTLSEIPVLPPSPTPVAALGSPGRIIDYYPALDAGDRDFGTLGDHVVRVNLKTTAKIENNKVFAQVYMSAEEWNKSTNKPAGDKTRAKGSSQWHELYSAPAGQRIVRLVTASVDNPARYIQEGHNDRTLQGTTDLVKTYQVYTDGLGDDVGSRTRVRVTFRAVSVELEATNPWCD